MKDKKKYVKICKQPFTPEFEAMIESDVIPNVNKEHFELLMDKVSEICSEKEGWNNCDTLFMLVTQLKAEMMVLIDLNMKVRPMSYEDLDNNPAG